MKMKNRIKQRIRDERGITRAVELTDGRIIAVEDLDLRIFEIKEEKLDK